jgi:tRNA A37 threonylcarbamoyladenosine biosynthesis protein TsaE
MEVDDLALEDLMQEAVMAIEWPDRWRHPPADAVRVSISVIDERSRRIEISGEDLAPART